MGHICSPEPCDLLSLEVDKPEESYLDNSDLKQISNPATEKTPVLPRFLLYIIKALHAEAKLSQLMKLRLQRPSRVRTTSAAERGPSNFILIIVSYTS